MNTTLCVDAMWELELEGISSRSIMGWEGDGFEGGFLVLGFDVWILLLYCRGEKVGLQSFVWLDFQEREGLMPVYAHGWEVKSNRLQVG